MSIRSSQAAPTGQRRGASDESEALAGIQFLSPEEAWALYDSEARELLGISADEFEEHWARGDLKERIEEPNVLRVYMIRTARPSL